ncbi:uncharacterized protein LOC144635584 [Oculina patagonica]
MASTTISCIFILVAFLISEASCSSGLYLKDEFHYLNVPGIGSIKAYDDFDCTFKCHRNPLCFSVNLAASKGADGKLWCELLSSDKYNNSDEYRENKSSHHFAMMSPCLPSPCRNGGTCVANYKDDTFKCLCENRFTGEYCEKAVTSCKVVYDTYKFNVSQVVELYFSVEQTSVLCHMGDFGCGDGAWTPVMKIDGNKNTFHYNGGYWSELSASILKLASLLPNCNKEGFNVASTDVTLGKARIGILGNNENDCIQCDSRIGFGTGGRHVDSNTCGNVEFYTQIKAMGYILVH